MIAEFNLDTPAMRDAFKQAPESEVSIVQQTTARGEPLEIVVNVASDSFDAFEQGLDVDDTVTDWVRFSEGEEPRRYRITLTDRGRELFTYPQWSSDGAVFLDGHRRRDGWRFCIQFPDEESLQRYVSYCEDCAIDFSPIRLARSTGSTVDDRFGLTSTQTSTLVTASQEGFFQIPRGCTLEELAADSDITHQALSERLRRGMGSLVDSTLR